MTRIGTFALLLTAIVIMAGPCPRALAAQNEAAPDTNADKLASLNAPVPTGWLERDTLTGDWGGARPWLSDHGLTLKLRLAQFYQGMTSGHGPHGFEYGSKADFLVNYNFDRFWLWQGLSVTTHGEYNFGQSVNGRGGTLMAVNAALELPGMGAMMPSTFPLCM